MDRLEVVSRSPSRNHSYVKGSDDGDALIESSTAILDDIPLTDLRNKSEIYGASFNFVS